MRNNQLLKITNIIVEGSDQQGKTTLCNMLAKKMGWEVFHFPPPSEDFDFYQDYILAPRTISDRNFPSEIVYSKFRDEEHRVIMLPQLLDEMRENTLFIFVDRGDDFVFEGRKEHFTEDQIELAREEYDDFFTQLRGYINIFKINVGDDDQLDELFELIEVILCGQSKNQSPKGTLSTLSSNLMTF